ncbi:prephenate dehydrogenase/arogenate dehydrogenase family protein [Pokkaliibacter sp. CJK22405]|uniref:prephenate dehydrogenase/arogenate dehydrogenase family protein n=1 Tax=Pokkaliibacter sp. CJK22405 TaxID=3384615 RepID=UPI003984E329
MSRFSTEHILFIGLGLIGGSLALALKKKGTSSTLTGFDLKEENCQLALSRGAVDRIADSLESAVREATMIVLAVPVKAMESVLTQIAPFLKENVLLTDVGSTKGNLVSFSRRLFSPMPEGWVPGHPIAGAENSGMSAAKEDLFQRHKVILTPLPESSIEATSMIRQVWEMAGAEVLEMAVEHHDEVLAATSHLPHLLAFSLVDTLAKDQENLDIFRYAAGGFRDFTRIAASDPTMWHDIFLANKSSVLNVLDRFTDDLAVLRKAVETGDSLSMLGVFTRAKAAREHFSRILEGTAYTSDAHLSGSSTYEVHPGSFCRGRIDIPGDRSISHRAVILGAIAEGTTVIEGFYENEDSLAVIQGLRDMGVVIEGPKEGRLTVHGVGLHGLKQPPGEIYLGRSATSMRLLTGLLSGQSFDSVLTGDAFLSSRSMAETAQAIKSIGGIARTQTGHAPIYLHGKAVLEGGDVSLSTPSAQIKSALLLAGLYASSGVNIKLPVVTRDHTERMLARFGAHIRYSENSVALAPGSVLKATTVNVPADCSYAAYFVVLAAVTPGSDIVLENVGLNPTRTGFLNALKAMGANIEIEPHPVSCETEEPMGNLRVRYQALKGASLDETVVSRATDELMLLVVAASFAEGITTFNMGSAQRSLTMKSIQSLGAELRKLGIVIETQDVISVMGLANSSDPSPLLQSAALTCQGNQRLALALSIAASRASGKVTIEECEGLDAYFTSFQTLAKSAGLNLTTTG